jgi:hypothetical protein
MSRSVVAPARSASKIIGEPVSPVLIGVGLDDSLTNHASLGEPGAAEDNPRARPEEPRLTEAAQRDRDPREGAQRPATGRRGADVNLGRKGTRGRSQILRGTGAVSGAAAALDRLCERRGARPR